VQLEGLSKLKNPVTLSGIEPVTFWLVKCLRKGGYRYTGKRGKKIGL
jgi:hypothetical protein